MKFASSLDVLLDLLYPRECLLCEKRLDKEPNRGVCLTCLSELGWKQEIFCPHCGAPKGEEPSCADCLNAKFAFDSLWSYGPYQGRLQRVIHTFKFQKDRGIGRDLAQFLSHSPSLRDYLKKFQVLIPVPMHPLKEKERGYNQTMVLAQELTRIVPLELWSKILINTKPSVSQVGLGQRARWTNVKDAFAIRRATDIKRKDVVLLDDVLTTGATAHACAGLLRQAGASSVGVLVLARGLAEGYRL